MERFVPFLQFPPAVRKIIYTTNSIESAIRGLRKATKNRVQFPNDDLGNKDLVAHAMQPEKTGGHLNALCQGKQPSASTGRLLEGGRVSGWNQAINQMVVAYPERFEKYL